MSSPSSPPSSSNEFLDGLKFGQKVYFEAKPNGGSSSSSGITTKKGNQQPPRCQVEGCKVDLSGAKAYYSRHKVCCMHSKSPIVVVSGLEQRFCQQCSRFHQLPEFDQGKRSCRRRLADHNERRRKPHPTSLLTSHFTKLSPSTFDDNNKGNDFMMECASYPKFSSSNALATQTSYEPVCRDRTTPFTWQNNTEPPSDFFQQGSVGGTNFLSPRHPPMESYNEVADSSCALSLLSNHTWDSRNTTPSVEMNNLLSFNETLMSQSSQGAASYQLSNASWFLKGIDSGNCSAEDVPDLELGQNSHTLHSNLPGELDVSQDKRHYWSL